MQNVNWLMLYSVSILSDLGMVLYNRNYGDSTTSENKLNILNSLNYAILNMANKTEDKKIDLVALGLKFTIHRKNNLFIQIITTTKFPDLFCDYISHKIMSIDEIVSLTQVKEMTPIVISKLVDSAKMTNLENKINDLIDLFNEKLMMPFLDTEYNNNLTTLFEFLDERDKYRTISNSKSHSLPEKMVEATKKRYTIKHTARDIIKNEVIPYDFLSLTKFQEYLNQIITIMDELESYMEENEENHLLIHLPLLKELVSYFSNYKFRAALWVESSIF